MPEHRRESQMIAEAVAISITNARLVSESQIELSFDDGSVRTIDFKEFLFSAIHPDIVKYRDPLLFSQFEIAGGDLMWNDWELCFPLVDLYEGTI